MLVAQGGTAQDSMGDAVTETQLQAQILKALSAAGAWAFRINTGRWQVRNGWVQGAPEGTPDICLVYPSGWMEVKLPGESLNPDQELWHKRALDRGIRVATVCSIEEAIRTVLEWRQ